MIVLIVTPTRNIEDFLDETISSVVSQVGNFDIYYHIQDSKSSDSTVEIIKKWERVLSNPETCHQNSRIYFSWVSESDAGMYDAINLGFRHLLDLIGDSNPEKVVMGWINGDDTLAQGALQTVVEFFSNTHYKWVTGIPSLIRDDSAIVNIRDSPCCFSRHLLRKGFYDGRHFQFVQQEGSFWLQSLWEVAGPLRSDLKLAGDWDLWRRFAEHSELVTLSAVLGFHRRRDGQLSSSMKAYHREVDEVLDSLNSTFIGEEPLVDRYLALIGRWNTDTSEWQVDEHEFSDFYSIIRDLQSRLQNQESERSQLHNANIQLRQHVELLRNQVAVLGREVEQLQIGRIAFKQVIKSLLKRLKLYDLLIQLREKARSFKDRDLESHTTSISQTQVNLASKSVEAFIMLKGITSKGYPDIQSDAFPFFADLVSESRQVLFIQPTKRLALLAQAFACQGSSVVCVNCANSLVPSLEASGVGTTSKNLIAWIKDTNQATSAQFDLVCLDSNLSEVDWQLLQYRLPQEAKVIIHENSSFLPNFEDLITKSGAIPTAWDMPHIVHDELRLYAAPPPAWVTPFSSLPKIDNNQQWPWNYPVIESLSMLPSGNPWPKISVVTVTLNQAEYLEETIRSVLMQGYPNLEYIVIDGGSTDNTVDILDRYRNELTHCISEPDNGQSDALNKGFQLATGDILAWLNSDDCYLPLALFRVAMAFDCYATDMVVGGCQLREDFSPIPFKTHHNSIPLGKPSQFPLKRLLDLENCWKRGDFFYQPEVFWTKELWERSGAGLSEELFYSMDYELWLRMAYQKATILHIPEPIALFRVHKQQKTFGNELPYFPELERVAAEFTNKFLRV